MALVIILQHATLLMEKTLQNLPLKVIKYMQCK